jgi:type II secretion system protein G
MGAKQKFMQRGFSLMELMIALTIMGILAVVTMKTFFAQTDEARRMKAFTELREVSNGLAEYYMKNGSFPELASWEAMVSGQTPLVNANVIRTNIPLNDPWGNPYEGRSTRTSYELKCAGRPDLGSELGPIIITNEKTIGAPGERSESAPATPATAQ